MSVGLLTEVDDDKVIGKNDKDEPVTVKQALDSSSDNPTMAKLKKKAQDLRDKDKDKSDDDAKVKKQTKIDTNPFDDEEKPSGDEPSDEPESKSSTQKKLELEKEHERIIDKINKAMDAGKSPDYVKKLEKKADKIDAMLTKIDPNWQRVPDEVTDPEGVSAVEAGEAEDYIESNDLDYSAIQHMLDSLGATGYKKTSDNATGPEVVQKYIDYLKAGEDKNGYPFTGMGAKKKIGRLMQQFVKDNPIDKTESIKVINGKKYKAIKESKKSEKHPIKEQYERLFSNRNTI